MYGITAVVFISVVVTQPPITVDITDTMTFASKDCASFALSPVHSQRCSCCVWSKQNKIPMAGMIVQISHSNPSYFQI